jgi:SP family general alpha glucoside:H+ symporter-like MFS transporter
LGKFFAGKLSRCLVSCILPTPLGCTETTWLNCEESSVPWGIFATIGPAYASELCPLPVRAYLTAYTNVCFSIGQLIGAGVLQSFLNRADDWAWRIPFALQWLWIPFLLIGGILMPESPWYLVRNGRYEEAEKTVLRLMTEPERPQARPLVALMIHTNELERDISSGTSYWDCFKPADRRRTEIACVTFLGQITCGAQFAYSATYFFQQAGLSPDNSYKLNLGGTAIAFCGTIASWFLMRVIGRRTLYLSGMGGMALWLFIIGGLAIDTTNQSVKWVQSAVCIVWLLTFSLTVGPVGWAIPAEVSSTRLRSKTVVLARASYYVIQIVANVIQPYMMNPSAWNWKGTCEPCFWPRMTILEFISHVDRQNWFLLVCLGISHPGVGILQAARDQRPKL